MALVGEAGIGKTTLFLSHLARTDQQQWKTIYLHDAHITFPALLKRIHQELGRDVKTEFISRMVQNLYKALIEEYNNNYNVILVIDNAQYISEATLANLWLLTNMKISSDRLIQIVLIGRPELEWKFRLSTSKRFKKQTKIFSHLSPLTKQESVDYIFYKMGQAITKEDFIFAEETLKKFVKTARGIPRNLNTIYTDVLEHGFQEQEKTFLGTKAQRIRKHIERVWHATLWQPAWMGLVGLLLVAILFGRFFHSNLIVPLLKEAQNVSQLAPQSPSMFSEHKAEPSADVTVRGVRRKPSVTEETLPGVHLERSLDTPSIDATAHVDQPPSPLTKTTLPPRADERLGVVKKVAALIDQFFPDGGDFQLNVWTDQGANAVYTEGEKLHLSILARTDAYLQVDYYQADGQVVHLLPNPLDSNLVKADKTLILGKSDSSFEFSITAPFGVEVLMVIASQYALAYQPERPNIEPSAAYIDRLARHLKEQKSQGKIAAVHLNIRAKQR